VCYSTLHTGTYTHDTETQSGDVYTNLTTRKSVNKQPPSSTFAGRAEKPTMRHLGGAPACGNTEVAGSQRTLLVGRSCAYASMNTPTTRPMVT
jgi:hypothetical protein